MVVVLAAAAMPAVTGQVETAKESIDIDTLRAAYSVAYTQAYMDANNGAGMNSSGYVVKISMTQTETGWRGSAPKIGGKEVSAATGLTDISTADTVTFKFTLEDSGALTTSSVELSKAS